MRLLIASLVHFFLPPSVYIWRAADHTTKLCRHSTSAWRPSRMERASCWLRARELARVTAKLDYNIPNFNQVHPHSPPSMVCFALDGLRSKAIRHALEVCSRKSKKPPLSYTRFEPRASPKDRIFSRTRTEIRKGSKKEPQAQVSDEEEQKRGSNGCEGYEKVKRWRKRKTKRRESEGKMQLWTSSHWIWIM